MDPAKIASMAEGPAGEDKLMAALRQAGALRATTTASAIRAALDALSAHRIVLITPYTQETTDHEAEFLHSVGYEVLAARAWELRSALSLARHSVDLSTPYFIPDAPLMALLRVLGYRGVQVRLHLPKETDRSFMTWATREYYDDLLDAGEKTLFRRLSVFAGGCTLDRHQVDVQRHDRPPATGRASWRWPRRRRAHRTGRTPARGCGRTRPGSAF